MPFVYVITVVTAKLEVEKSESGNMFFRATVWNLLSSVLFPGTVADQALYRG